MKNLKTIFATVLFLSGITSNAQQVGQLPELEGAWKLDRVEYVENGKATNISSLNIPADIYYTCPVKIEMQKGLCWVYFNDGIGKELTCSFSELQNSSVINFALKGQAANAEKFNNTYELKANGNQLVLSYSHNSKSTKTVQYIYHYSLIKQ
jgi:hypothetical protein